MSAIKPSHALPKPYNLNGRPVQPSRGHKIVATLSASRGQRRTFVNPAKLFGQRKSSVDIVDNPANPLSQYMRLPAEMYYELDPKMIKPLGGASFKLQVPKISLFNVYIEPEAIITVQNEDYRVVLQSDQCHLHGSAIIEQLDKKFDVAFKTILTWEPGVNGRKGSIHADLTLQVDTEVISPFHLLPKSVLESTCNAVLATLISSLLPLFLKKLAADYQKWAVDAEYRAKRARMVQVQKVF